MNTKNLPDYYPVYKDLSDRMRHEHSEKKQNEPALDKPLSPETKNPKPDTSISPVMLNAEELTDLSLKCSFSPFQTVILLLKNAFEGHVFLTWKSRPDQLFSQGTLLFRAKPEFMLFSFFKDFDRYKPGLIQIWKNLQEKVTGLGGISFDLLLHTIITNHLIRLPVSLFSLYDIRSFSDSLPTNQQAMDQRLEIVLLGENALGEHEFIQRVNFIYAEKYKEFVHQLSTKEGIFSHYQRKLALSLYPNIHTEEELDDLMYKKLVEDQVNRNSDDIPGPVPYDQLNSGTSDNMLRLTNKTKCLYRLVSKNCSEIHSSTDGENRFPELNNIFLKANSIYNEQVSDISEALLNNMRMMLLFSEVAILRKNKGLEIADNLQLISGFNEKELMSKDDFKTLRRNSDSNLVACRIKSFTDYKMKFVMDDDFTDIHNHFLQKQLDFIDQQIIQIQIDIKEVFKVKSDTSISKKSENQ
jgi:hypothetical protein